MTTKLIDPGYDCPTCPRLVAFRERYRESNPDWHNGPVDTWSAHGGDDEVKLLIVGLAPGLRGANRTGRPFTGDYAGDLLYSTMLKFGFAGGNYGATPDDSLKLKRAAITNAVRCVPPENKPVGAEINNCRPYLLDTLDRYKNLGALMTLGKIAHDTLCRALGERVAGHPFGHNRRHDMEKYTVFSSYHCSRYNTNTRRLTTPMFEDVFVQISEHLENPAPLSQPF